MWNLRVVHVAIFVVLSVLGLSHGDQECDPAQKYRTIDGSCNNLNHPTWAMAVTPFNRLLPNRYSDGVRKMPKSVTGNELPLPRHISNIMNPPGNKSDTQFTIGLMQFGQLLTHDISRMGILEDFNLPGTTGCCELPGFGSMGTNGEKFNDPICAPLIPPPDDPVYTKAGLTCGDFPRTLTSLDLKHTTPKEEAKPITIATGYADLSIVYGSNDTLANALRAFDKGLLKTLTRENQKWPIEDAGNCPLQPADEPCYKADFPPSTFLQYSGIEQSGILVEKAGEYADTLIVQTAIQMSSSYDSVIIVGDDRIRQSPHLAVLQTAYYRYHNIIAKLLKKINPHWDDEKLYQEARRINIALYQNVVYEEYIPRMVGEEFSYKNNLKYKSKSCVDDYDKETDASILLEFVTGAFRSPHTTIVGNLQLVDKDRKVIGDLRISDYILKPSILEKKTEGELNYDNLVRGLCHQPQDRPGAFNVETKHFFFKGNNEFGVDLRSWDILRDRDHGLGGYLKARKYCNLYVPKTFKDLRKIMSKENAQKLESLYEKIEDIELSVGGLAEPIEENARVGETNRCILKIQFQRTRYGDRFFYDNCGEHSFTKEQLKEIKKATFACMLCDTSDDVDHMQPSAFDLVGKNNKVTSCKKLCKLNLDAWKEKNPPKKCKKSENCKRKN